MKTFSEMSEKDYADLGLKVGLEIHQQVLTQKKLFCRCPAGQYSKEFDAEILRHMRPTLSELGEYDGTALMEYKTKKEIIYQINHKSVCTYEMDDTPPFEINDQALEIAFEIAMLLNSKLVDEIHIARKQYLDGSIPTGFQRTTIVGIDGWIPYKDRKINLIQLGLEEDACREVSDVGHQRVFVSDRLGMPLVEMVTGPEMHTPQQAADVANILRYLVRSTGKVRTGIGAARQDVNVSITGGTRVEIKGVHRIPLIPLLVYHEAMRQHALLKIRQELKERGITNKTFQANSHDVTQLVANSTWDPIRMALKREEKVHAVNLKNFMGILSYPTQTGKVFSKEISDRVRVIACLTRLPNILTSENTEETIESYIWSKIRKTLKTASHDSVILVWGMEEDIATAVKEIILRAREAITGVPGETRQAMVDGTNGFERILPGPDRMYPDTDLPPLEILPDRIDNIARNVPEQIWEREKKYQKWGIPEHLWVIIATSPRATFFEELVSKYSVPPTMIARFLFEISKYWKRKGFEFEHLKDTDWHIFFSKVEKNPALLEKGKSLLEKYMQEEDKLEIILESFLNDGKSKDTLESIIAEIIGQFRGKVKAENEHKYFMGLTMSTFRGFIRGDEVSRKLSEFIGKK
jgi:glutamyl-tRNA(Gln) amidotransferase subunit E